MTDVFHRSFVIAARIVQMFVSLYGGLNINRNICLVVLHL